MPGVITTCAKCGAQYSWNTDYQEYPDCPSCGYNAMKIDRAKRAECSSAAGRGDLAGVKQALGDPGVRNNLNAGPLTILHHAVSGNQIDVVKYLLSQGARPDTAYPQAGNETPLHIAASKGYHEIAKVLIDSGAKIDAKDSNGAKPIDRTADDAIIALLKPYDDTASMLSDYFEAVMNGKVDRVDTFLDKGIDPNQGEPRDDGVLGASALHFACGCFAGQGFSGCSPQVGRQMAEILIRHGADVNIRRNAEISALYDSAMNDRKDIAELLIENGADVDIRNGWKDTPLHVASYERAVEVMKLLIENGADVNARNDEGETPLHKATSSCPNDDFTMLRILIDAGAKMDIKCKNGNTPFDLTWMEGDKPKRDFLREAARTPGPSSIAQPGKKPKESSQAEARSDWTLKKYARAIAGGVTNRTPGEDSGLEKHRASIQKLGREIDQKWGLSAMQQVHKAIGDAMGSGASGDLSEIWAGVGKWPKSKKGN